MAASASLRKFLFTLAVIVVTDAFILSPEPTVQTECGPVQGVQTQHAYVFKGIPYASPPVGKLRWREPEVLKPNAGNCWNGTLNAAKYGNTCFQRNPSNESQMIGSEDCLYLNVLTPTLKKAAKKPVMVWIHGGSLQVLNGNWPLYSPTDKLANETDIVYVGFNYRLHAFGFMSLQILAADSSSNTSGNYGFMDMIAVLQWVQRNIANFGGDPNQVTVFGQSSGGTAIFALLASELCQGLFHKAWLSSASPVLNKTALDAYGDNFVFLVNTNCWTIDCLRNLSAEEVTSAVPWNTYPYWAMHDQGDLPTKGLFDGAIAVVDGVVLKDAPFDAWTKGKMVDVPVLVGSCANEIDDRPNDVTMNNWTWSQYVANVFYKLEPFGSLIRQEALTLYPPNVVTPEFQYTSMTSDLRVNCPSDVMSTIMASTFNSYVYRYVVTSRPSVPVYPGGAFPASYSFHMWDILAFFGFIPDYIANPTTDDIAWQKNVQNEVLKFVRNGVPSTSSWKPYPAVTAALSHVTTPTPAYNPVQCEFWLNNGFAAYAWVN